ncbi:RNA-directed DNA polymerase, eukaryota [Tanacetum coccineum]
MKVLGFVFNLLSSSFKTLVAFILSLSYEASSLSNLDPWIGVVTKGVFSIVGSFLTNWRVRGAGMAFGKQTWWYRVESDTLTREDAELYQRDVAGLIRNVPHLHLDNKKHRLQDRKVIQDSLIEIDLRLDKGICYPDDLTKRANLFRDLKDIDHKDSTDLAQKAKIKWAVEGDENSNFFHDIVNKKRRQVAIKGILVEGEWIENPNRVISEFYSYYSNLLSALALDRFLLDDNFPRRLDTDQAYDLEDMVSNEEIRKRVFFKWDCALKVRQGQMECTFGLSVLNGCQYKIIGKILANRLCLVIGDIVSQEQSAFIKGRQIMNGPLILNEVISWCKARKEQLLMFKVDFQKAFDSVRWDHLDDILGKFGFGNKWRG